MNSSEKGGLDFQTHSIACGFTHSCAISKQGLLYVWGDNSNQQLQKHVEGGSRVENKVLKQPTLVRLKCERLGSKAQKRIPAWAQMQKMITKGNDSYGVNEYRAIDVACGPFNTWVVARKEDKTKLVYDDAEGKEILKELKKILDEEGTLIRFFELHKRKDLLQCVDEKAEERDDYHEAGAELEEEEEQRVIEKLKELDPFAIDLQNDDFRRRIKELNQHWTESRIKGLEQEIAQQFRNRTDGGEKTSRDALVLGDIEDYALRFMQNNQKLFMFGQAHKSLRCFEDSSKVTAIKNTYQNSRKGKAVLDDDDIQIVHTPTPIKFPRFTKPIICVSAGSAHVLALTLDQEMFSWGEGSYGALGFGSTEDISSPQKLDLYDHQNKLHKVMQISCGKCHSLCLTSTHNIFSWGEAGHGRLGHNDEQLKDELYPREIYTLSQRKPIFISAGESHSAAITEKYKLFTWGNGGFGRLGHGTDTRQIAPKQVESMNKQEIIYVCCGSFHTLAVAKNKRVFAFGQNKYGKLGIGEAPLDACLEPKKINMYRANQQGSEPQKDKDDSIQVCSGFNHSMALARSGKAYSWGYAGKGLLGREKVLKDADPQENSTSRETHMLALPVGLGIAFNQTFKAADSAFIWDNLFDVIEGLHQKEAEDKAGGQAQLMASKMGDEEETVKQIACSSANTVALTRSGEVHVLGDNTYSQRGCEELSDDPDQVVDAEIKERDDNHYGKYSRTTKINFAFTTPDKIAYVACGGDHIFAKSQLDDIYGWGRNDEGQLGVGFLSEKVEAPTLIKDLCYKGVKQICCQDNYSAALSIYGNVYVCGSLSGGKLGLGRGQKRGYQLTFRAIPAEVLPEIDYIACGMEHMLAISRVSNEAGAPNPAKPSKGKTYAWGKNHRGQLGIGSKENQFSPHLIDNTKERFTKVACGYNFSLGLSSGNRVYFWGNFKYSGNTNTKADFEEPTVMQQLEQDVKDIACEYKYCVALVEREKKAELKKWGKYLADKDAPKAEKKTTGADDEVRVHMVEIFPVPQRQRLNQNFESVVTGPNHSCGISQNNGKVYVWGHNNVQNRLGLRDQNETNKAKDEPMQMTALERVLRQKREAANQNRAREYAFGGQADAEASLDHELAAGESQTMFDDELDEDEEEKVAEDSPEAIQEGKTAIQEGDIHVEVHDQAADDSEEHVQLNVTSKSAHHDHGGQLPRTMYDIISKKENEANKLQAKHQPEIPEITLIIINEISQFNQRQRKGKPVTKKRQAKDLNIFDYNVDLAALEYIRQEIHTKKEPHTMQIAHNKQTPGYVMLSNQALQKALKKEDEEYYDEKAIIRLDQETKSNVDKIILMVYSFSKAQMENKDHLQRAKTSFLSRIKEPPFDFKPQSAQELKHTRAEKELLDQKKQLQKALRLLQLHPCYIIKMLLLEEQVFSFEQKKLVVKQLFTSNKRSTQQRLNYLLISVFEEVLPHELEQCKKRLEEDKYQDEELPYIFGPKCRLISIYIFRRIFKSQPTNIDTICCFVCHIINHIMSQYTQGQGGPDPSLDVTDKIAAQAQQQEKNTKNKQSGKGANEKNQGVKVISDRAKELSKLISQMMEELNQNKVLVTTTQYFSFKRKVQDQLEFVKKQFRDVQEEKGGSLQGNIAPMNNDSKKQNVLTTLGEKIKPDCVQTSFPSIRFSEEIYYLLNVLNEQMHKIEAFTTKHDDFICSQLLGLTFQSYLQKIEKNKEMYLFPYLAKIKMIGFITTQLQEVHDLNIRNTLYTFIDMLTGQSPFRETAGAEKSAQDQRQAAMEILTRDLGYMNKDKHELLKKILRYGKEISRVLAYKNFEQQILHSLEQEDTQQFLSKKFIGELFLLIQKQPSAFALQIQHANDPLIQITKEMDEKDLKFLSKLPSYSDKIDLKLKTRLFTSMDFKDGPKYKKQIEERLQQFVRCNKCQATLDQDIAMQNFDLSIVQSQYEPQDKESVMTEYCNILKILESPGGNEKSSKSKDAKNQGKKEHKNMYDFIDAAVKNSQSQNELSARIQDFNRKLSIEVQNIQVREMQQEKKRVEQKGNKEKTDEWDWWGLDDEAIEKDKVLKEKKRNRQVKDTDTAVFDLIKESEKKVHQRIKQKYNLMLIQTQINRYLMPQIQSRIEAFKAQLMSHNQEMQQNYSYGLANRDLLALQSCQGLRYMAEVVKFTDSQSMSRNLSGNLSKTQKQAIRGYLSLSARTLQENGTIKDVRLKELAPLLSKSNVVMIESDDRQYIQFKLVYQELKHGMCGPPKVINEQILVNFNIYPKTLKTMVQAAEKEKEAFQKANERKVQDKTADNDKDNDHGKLVFPENDALTFDPTHFNALITQMERQKSAYVLQAEPGASETAK